MLLKAMAAADLGEKILSVGPSRMDPMSWTALKSLDLLSPDTGDEKLEEDKA